MANTYNPVRSMPGGGYTRSLRPVEEPDPGGGGGPVDPIDRQPPEVTPPPAWETQPTEPEVPGEPGGPGPEPEPPTSPSVPVGLPPVVNPGSFAAMRPYRTPGFFKNRFVGGRQLGTSRIGPGASVTGSAGEPAQPLQLDEETMRSLVAKFGGAGRFGGPIQ